MIHITLSMSIFPKVGHSNVPSWLPSVLIYLDHDGLRIPVSPPRSPVSSFNLLKQVRAFEIIQIVDVI